jgi:SET domain
LLGLYPLAAMLNHSCLANAVRVYVGELMIVHACQDIAAGEEVVWSYLPPTTEYGPRRELLQQQHGFVCHCQRCRVEKEATGSVIDETLSEWNTHLVEVSGMSVDQVKALYDAFDYLDTVLGGDSSLSNEAKRYLRVGYTYLHMNYLNAKLATLMTDATQDNEAVRNHVLAMATQLHFSFCASHNASTEDLSVSKKWSCVVVSVRRLLCVCRSASHIR